MLANYNKNLLKKIMQYDSGVILALLSNELIGAAK